MTTTKTLDQKKTILTVLRWIARIWSIISLVFLLILLIGEIWAAVNAGVATLPIVLEWIGFIFFPLGIIVGLVWAWKNELTGASITIASFIIFYVYILIIRGGLPRDPYFMLVALPGLLFLIVWLLKKDWQTTTPKSKPKTKKTKKIKK